MAALESFERALKESTSNVLEGFDGVDKSSYEQTRGYLILFNAIKLLSHSTFALIRLSFTIFLFQTITTCFEIICIDHVDGLEIYKLNMHF